ncbi:MAG: Mov34/MPN/PAD-1 family protein [Nanoarchaeota archaeon]
MKLFDWLKLPSFRYNEVRVLRSVVETIEELARNSSPLEFTALLEGSVKRETLYITGIIFQQFEASENATAMHMDLPMVHNTVGSVHSHPGASNKPSDTDLQFFGKHGIFHLIIRFPFAEGDIAGYDKMGRKIEFQVIERKD